MIMGCGTGHFGGSLRISGFGCLGMRVQAPPATPAGAFPDRARCLPLQNIDAAAVVLTRGVFEPESRVSGGKSSGIPGNAGSLDKAPATVGMPISLAGVAWDIRRQRPAVNCVGRAPVDCGIGGHSHGGGHRPRRRTDGERSATQERKFPIVKNPAV